MRLFSVLLIICLAGLVMTAFGLYHSYERICVIGAIITITTSGLLNLLEARFTECLNP